MKKIDLDNYNRRGLFNSFKDRDIPYFSTTCNIEIQDLKKFVKLRNISFFVSFSYIISVSVNRIPQLRHRIIDGELYEFKIVDPGYTVLLDDETFSSSFVHPYDKLYSSIPIITIGKYFEQGDSWLIPIAMQVHHGVVDGFHVGKYYDCLEKLCKNPEVVLGKIKTS
jgi:chloramphenicol O-acetyltransferase type A